MKRNLGNELKCLFAWSASTACGLKPRSWQRQTAGLHTRGLHERLRWFHLSKGLRRNSKNQQEQKKDSLGGRGVLEKCFLVYIYRKHCFLALSKSPNSKTSSSTPFNPLVLSLPGCSDAIMKVMYPNRVRKSIIKTKIKWKAEGYMCQDKVAIIFLEERCVSGPWCFFQD